MFDLVSNFKVLHGYLNNHTLKYDYHNHHIHVCHTCYMRYVINQTKLRDPTLGPRFWYNNTYI